MMKRQLCPHEGLQAYTRTYLIISVEPVVLQSKLRKVIFCPFAGSLLLHCNNFAMGRITNADLMVNIFFFQLGNILLLVTQFSDLWVTETVVLNCLMT
jgi:hypothetical protein